MLRKMWTRFAPGRLAVVFLGNRLAGAVVQQDRVETFVVEAEDPAAALRAEPDARGPAPPPPRGPPGPGAREPPRKADRAAADRRRARRHGAVRARAAPALPRRRRALPLPAPAARR